MDLASVGFEQEADLTSSGSGIVAPSACTVAVFGSVDVAGVDAVTAADFVVEVVSSCLDADFPSE